MITALADEVRAGRVLLFAGAGVSAGLGLPTWKGLIEFLGADLGFEPGVFQSLSASFLPLAEYYKLERSSFGALRSWMDRSWNVKDRVIRKSKIHRLLIDLKFPLIYTTNYDRLIERAYELDGQRINKIVTAKDIARADSRLPTLVKFHGDFDEDKSLVISESDYFRRLAFEGPLDIKLRADVLGRTVLFIGYSLTDINIRLMIFRLRNMWVDSGQEKLQPRSYVFLSRPNIVQQTILESWGVTPIVGDSVDESDALRGFLSDLKSAVDNKS